MEKIVYVYTYIIHMHGNLAWQADIMISSTSDNATCVCACALGGFCCVLYEPLLRLSLVLQDDRHTHTKYVHVYNTKYVHVYNTKYVHVYNAKNMRMSANHNAHISSQEKTPLQSCRYIVCKCRYMYKP